MSYKQMTGNIISATKVEPDGSTFADAVASGVWSLQDQYDYKKGGNWPITGFLPIGLFGSIDTANNGSEVGIERININSTGNSIDTADLSVSRDGLGSCGSSTRAIWMGGGSSNVIDFTTFASLGDATDFGNLSANAGGCVAACNSTRAVIIRLDDIFYITMASEGNSSSFGNHPGADKSYCTACGNDTRILFFGGVNDEQDITYVTIATTGNGANFGDCQHSYSHQANGMICSNTRGIAAGGYASNSGGRTNVIVYSTIASLGNATDFGDLTAQKYDMGACSSTIRGVMSGGADNNKSNVIEYITIATTGNGTDFGDLTIAEATGIAGCSAVHGGLQ